MKLPEYDNRPRPGEPLYQDPNADKGYFLLLLQLLAGLFLLGFSAWGFVSLIQSLFR